MLYDAWVSPHGQVLQVPICRELQAYHVGMMVDPGAREAAAAALGNDTELRQQDSRAS